MHRGAFLSGGEFRAGSRPPLWRPSNMTPATFVVETLNVPCFDVDDHPNLPRAGMSYDYGVSRESEYFVFKVGCTSADLATTSLDRYSLRTDLV